MVKESEKYRPVGLEPVGYCYVGSNTFPKLFLYDVNDMVKWKQKQVRKIFIFLFFYQYLVDLHQFDILGHFNVICL